MEARPKRFDRRRWGVFLLAQGRQGVRRVRGSFVPILQAAAAASAAWLIAEWLFGRINPMFAPIAAFVCLGFKADRVPRKVVEMGVGATAGVLLGELFALWFEVGWWQIGLALMAGALTGRFLDKGDLTTFQAAVNAVVVLCLSWWQAVIGGVGGRWMDAIVGAAVAFVVAVLLPRHPTSRARRYARSTLTELATMLGVIGQGLTRGDPELLRDARGQWRAVGELTADWEETLSTARSVVAVNPSLWKLRGEVRELERLYRLTSRTRRSAYMLARQGLAMVPTTGPLPEVGGIVTRASHATHALAGSVSQWSRPVMARQTLLELAARATPAGLDAAGWRPAALMSVTRAILVDLLQLTGLAREQALDALADRAAQPSRDLGDEGPRPESDDRASPLWGT